MLISLFSCQAPAPDTEMTVTTSSDEALNYYFQGVEYWDAVEADKAAEMFDKAIEADPNFMMAYFYRATSGGGNDVYITNLQKAFSLMDQVSEGEQVFLKMLKNQWEGNGEAMNLYADSLLNMYPEDKRIPYLIGIWNLNGDIEENNELIKRSVALDENFAAAYSVLTDNYSFLKTFDQAEQYARKYMELLPDKADPYLKMGTLYRQQGKLDQAIDMYLKMLDVDPESRPYVYIGNCYTFKADYQKAREYYMEHYEKAKLVDYRLSSLFNYSISYIFEGDMEGALESMVKYREEAEKEGITSTVIWSYLYQTAIAWAFDDYDTSEKYLDQAVAMIETSDLDQTMRENLERNQHAWRGYLLIGRGDLEEAKKQIDTYYAHAQEREMSSEIRNANFYYGLIALKKGEYGNAVSYLNQAGENYMEWYYLGVAHEALGNLDQAREYYEKVANSYLLSINLAFVRDEAIQKLEEL